LRDALDNTAQPTRETWQDYVLERIANQIDGLERKSYHLERSVTMLHHVVDDFRHGWPQVHATSPARTHASSAESAHAAHDPDSPQQHSGRRRRRTFRVAASAAAAIGPSRQTSASSPRAAQGQVLAIDDPSAWHGTGSPTGSSPPTACPAAPAVLHLHLEHSVSGTDVSSDDQIGEASQAENEVKREVANVEPAPPSSPERSPSTLNRLWTSVGGGKTTTPIPSTAAATQQAVSSEPSSPVGAQPQATRATAGGTSAGAAGDRSPSAPECSAERGGSGAANHGPAAVHEPAEDAPKPRQHRWSRKERDSDSLTEGEDEPPSLRDDLGHSTFL
jgi:hypothetical protein